MGKLIAGQLPSARTEPDDSCTAAIFVLGDMVRESQCATLIQPGSKRNRPAITFPYSVRFRSPKDGPILCKAGPDLIWFWLTVSGFGQADLVRKQAGVQESSGPIPQNEPGPLPVSCIRFRSVLPKTARTILCETGADPIWFWVAMSGCGQTDPARKQTDK